MRSACCARTGTAGPRTRAAGVGEVPQPFGHGPGVAVQRPGVAVGGAVVVVDGDGARAEGGSSDRPEGAEVGECASTVRPAPQVQRVGVDVHVVGLRREHLVGVAATERGAV